MSARVRTNTPFINKNFLTKALDNLKVNYKLQGEDIVTERIDFYGEQVFVKVGERYQFMHDSSANREYYSWRKINFKQFKTVNQFLDAVNKEYIQIEKAYYEELKRLEEERKRLELERQRQAEIQKIVQEQKAKEEELKRIQEEIRKREEEIRLEQEKKAQIVKEQETKIEQKAKELGYQVRKKQVGNKIQIVLVRHS